MGPLVVNNLYNSKKQSTKVKCIGVFLFLVRFGCHVCRYFVEAMRNDGGFPEKELRFASRLVTWRHAPTHHGAARAHCGACGACSRRGGGETRFCFPLSVFFLALCVCVCVSLVRCWNEFGFSFSLAPGSFFNVRGR